MTRQRSYGLGPEGFCICPKCGTKKAHRRGTPCQMEKCPKCGSKMIRENSNHHRLLKKSKNKFLEEKNVKKP
jgi:uncharacterized membrane protein YvbJ